ncbi:MAG TPA: tannase/feruloyl esterase family alpha/beta hydrolase [Croceibacterium sp.]
MAADCGALAQMALPGGKVTAAELVAPGAFRQPASPGAPPGVGAGAYGNLPEFCRVQATLTPTSDSDIKVEVWLPANGWNGKFVGVGNGIWAGQLSYSALAETIARGYAAASTDTGHTGNGLTGEFAVGHPEKLVDFGHRAVHEMVVTAKAAIAAFYGNGPQKSYWNSCSTGGRQGLMAAYRYPADFDAISAMAPANPMTDLMTQSMWAGWQPNRAPGAMVPMPQMTAVHRAAVKQCDKLDGLEDGLIGRPDVCDFDPATVEGLTPAQVETVRAIYNGPPGLTGWPVGSELQLGALTQGPQPFPVALTYYSLLAFGDRTGWDWKTFDYTRDAQAGRDYGAGILDVPYTGLGAFFARGGKLLLSHGWTDGLIPATNTLKFYDGLRPTLSADQAANQLRLFMVPGMDHCGGGEGASQFDTLGTIDEWATTGRTPDLIHASRPTAASGLPGAPPAAPRAPLSRPLCAWPAYAEYKGEGDANAEASFRCVTPART